MQWATATVLTAVLQIGYTAVMARLLPPTAFGLAGVLCFGKYFAGMAWGTPQCSACTSTTMPAAGPLQPSLQATVLAYVFHH